MNRETLKPLFTPSKNAEYSEANSYDAGVLSGNDCISKESETTLTGSNSSNYVDVWDTSHVKMPCSPRNLYYEDVGYNFVIKLICDI